MSFTGELEHLPIVDVIQLLHSTRKSGILRVASRKGESQLVFKDGYIVSANHLNSSVRIGTILIERNIITPEVLDRALQAQRAAGRERKPLIVMLLERGAVREEDAYKGLEQLIELTVVEMLTWKRGTFTLDVLPSSVSDEYRYYPERISREINVDTQGVLMDALRVFDEKMRDGTLAEDDFPAEEVPLLSADDLGLADLDRLERKIPEVFTGLAERDPAAVHRQKLEEIAPDLSLPEREELAAFLGEFFPAPSVAGGGHVVIFFSPDELAGHAVAAACAPAGIRVIAVADEQELDPLLGAGAQILVIDVPRQDDALFSRREITAVRQRKKSRYPHLCTIQLAAPDDAAFTLHAYGEGARAVFPGPSREERRETFVADTIRFLTAFPPYLKALAAERENSAAGRLKAAIIRLRDLRDAPALARALLEGMAGICERALTLVVRDAELIADRGMGVGPAAGVRIPLAQPSLFRDVIAEGHVYCGPAADELLTERLFAAIGAPRSATVLLLPLRSRGKTLALTYGDFGGNEPVPVETDLLEIMATQAELVLENCLYRKKLAKSAR